MSDTVSTRSSEATIEEIDERGLMDLIDPLSDILVRCVHEGASLGFMMPFEKEDAVSYWCDLATAVAVRGRRLIVARSANRIAGTLQLILAMPPNGGHRAEVAKLMVSPDFRRLRIAQSMLRFAEGIARQESRTLLIGTTRTGGPTEHINSLLGFKLAGVVPHYVRGPHGQFSDTSFMYKDLTD
jgi:ribosomal protein S18 acetylase RimI-like enzyme